MLVKDQLRVRMDQLSVSVKQVAEAVGVSNQTVRWWLDGRNLPGKRHLAPLEKYLQFKLDYSQDEAGSAGPTVAAEMERIDVELFLTINKFPADVKIQIHHMLRAILDSMQNKVSGPPPPQEQEAKGSSRRRA